MKYTQGRGFGPVMVRGGCRVYKQDDGSYYVFNHIGLGYGDTRISERQCPHAEQVCDE